MGEEGREFIYVLLYIYMLCSLLFMIVCFLFQKNEEIPFYGCLACMLVIMFLLVGALCYLLLCYKLRGF